MENLSNFILYEIFKSILVIKTLSTYYAKCNKKQSLVQKIDLIFEFIISLFKNYIYYMIEHSQDKLNKFRVKTKKKKKNYTDESLVSDYLTFGQAGEMHSRKHNRCKIKTFVG